jgi:hypothetical protein
MMCGIEDNRGWVRYKKVRATGFEPATVGFGVQRSTVGATPSGDAFFLSAPSYKASLQKPPFSLVVGTRWSVIYIG